MLNMEKLMYKIINIHKAETKNFSMNRMNWTEKISFVVYIQFRGVVQDLDEFLWNLSSKTKTHIPLLRN